MDQKFMLKKELSEINFMDIQRLEEKLADLATSVDD
jgi:hypothetical protein